jgi:uncharacterized protein YkwD
VTPGSNLASVTRLLSGTATLAILVSALALAVFPAAAWAAAPAGTIAPVSACPNQTDPRASNGERVRAMRCLTNFARRGRGLAEMRASGLLDRAAGRKSADILSCGEFSHEACGRPFTYWIERFGYLRRCGSAAENIAWGSGSLGSVRSIFRSWMRSSGHRRNILGRFEEIGIGLRVGRLDGTAGAKVWTQNFGGSC